MSKIAVAVGGGVKVKRFDGLFARRIGGAVVED
jgi:hypothetical protein